MTLTTHATLGALVGAVASQNLALAAAAAFMSHFLFDAIPHWDYRLSSANEDRANPMNNDIKAQGFTFIKDLAKVGFDFCLGLAIAVLVFYSVSPLVLTGAVVGAFFAMLPDPLQFVYMKLKVEPFISLQRFHMFMHAKLHLKDRPVFGVGIQLLFIIIIISLSKYIFYIK